MSTGTSTTAPKSKAKPKAKAPAKSNKAALAKQVDDDRYEVCLAGVRERFAARGTGPFFTVDADDLWSLYLDAAPPRVRQSRNCHCCRNFIQRFGGLVTILPDGTTSSALWDPSTAPPAYVDAVAKLARRIERATIRDVFVCSDREWGKGETGEWTHFSLAPHPSVLWSGTLLNAHQRIAEKRQDYETLRRSLAEFPIENVRLAHNYLTNGSLFRSEKCVGVAAWLLELHEKMAASKNNRIRDNLAWLAAATAPPGFCHVKSGMIGTLLEDIAAGYPFDTIKQRFDSKMDPRFYQRPQAAPTAGNIAQAEKIVAALGLERSLERRFARLSDVEALWLPKPPRPDRADEGGGVFAHLKAKATETPLTSNAPAVTMTWAKFAATVLPNAEAIEFSVPRANEHYAAMIAPVHADAPPIVQWDRMDRRNGITWYTYIHGSPAYQWNLNVGEWREVTAVVPQPSMWGPTPSAHHGQSMFFVLKGARDISYTRGSGMFPELMRSERHAIRATMEAHFKQAIVSGAEDAEVCGVRLQKGGQWSAQFRVTANGVRTTYRLDRWD